MKQIVTHCFAAIRNRFLPTFGSFELIGFDFLVDDNLKVKRQSVLKIRLGASTNSNIIRIPIYIYIYIYIYIS